jgi:prepilin-type N-terminal cleavage/methylation domain-containing protein
LHSQGGGSSKTLILSGFRPIEKFKKLFNPAFTLAEVLITLGIIGVVAAMTIPNLMAKINERQTVVKLKKAYSTLANAMRILEQDEEIDWASCVSSYDYAQLQMGTSEKGIECEKRLASVLKGTYLPASTPGLDYNQGDGVITSGIQGLDGITYFLQCGLIDIMGFVVDVNGMKNGPNIMGKDVFAFKYSKSTYDNDSKKWISFNSFRLTPSNSSAKAGDSCDKDHIGLQCTATVLKTGKMDYLYGKQTSTSNTSSNSTTSTTQSNNSSTSNSSSNVSTTTNNNNNSTTFVCNILDNSNSSSFTCGIMN